MWNENTARIVAKEIGEDIAERGRHATEPSHLLHWAQAFTLWSTSVSVIGKDAALAAAFEGYNNNANERAKGVADA